MSPRICRSCGEPLPDGGNVLSRNPNICASCSSMADGMGEANAPELAGGESEHATSAKPEEGTVTEVEAGPGIHEVPV